MIIDDHTLIRETWCSLLATVENFKIVAQSGDGNLAIELAKETRPDIVLLDINMLPLDGAKVLGMIRKLSPASKIIIVSMHAEPAYAKKMLRLGAKGYVSKTSTREELIDAINEVLKGNIYICKEVSRILAAQLNKDNQDTPDINSLSQRELQVLALLSDGGSSKDIASELGLSPKTIEVHRYNILKKMKSKSTVSLIQYINSNAVDI